MAKKLAFDRLLFTGVLVLVGLGLAMVYSASAVVGLDAPRGPSSFLVKQGTAALLGLLGMVAAMHLDYRRLQRRWVVYALLGAAMALLVGALFSPALNHARRWLLVAGLSFQPSELAKPVLVIYLAYQIARKQERPGRVELLLPAALVSALLALLVYLGRDLGSALLLALVAGLMLFLAGVPWLHLTVGVAGLSPLVASAVVFEPYRWERIKAFLEPAADPLNQGFQSAQSRIAVGSGGLLGLGLGKGLQKLHFLPYPHSDFVFATVAEELGMAGALGVLALFAMLLWRGVRAGRRAPDAFGRHLAFGLSGLLVIQALLHVSVSLAVLPATGITLPFISYGGSSLVVAMTASGVLLNISQHG